MKMTCLAVALSSLFILAQNPEEILEKAAKAQLGETRAEDIYSVHTKGVITLPGGIVGEFESFYKEGSKYYQKASVPAVGLEIIQACDGKDCYSQEPMLGPRLLTGQELSNTLLEADFQSEINWKETFTSYQFLGTADIEGVPCYKLNLVTRTGLEVTNYYNIETALLKRTDTVVVHQDLGTISGKIYYDHYQEFEGIKMPTLIVFEMISGRMEMRRDMYEFNQKVDDSLFVIPTELKASAQ